MLHFLDLFEAEINFFKMFSFSVVYASVFGNPRISSLWKIVKSLITRIKARRGILGSFFGFSFFLYF